MYLITKEQGGYRAIPIRTGDTWSFHKVLPGNREVRIVLRVKGRRYLLYSTRTLTAKYPVLGREQLTALCDDVITLTSECIGKHHQYIDFERIAGTAEYRHQRHWCDHGLIHPVPLEEYYGHTLEPKAEQLVSYVRVNHGDVIVIDNEPPVCCEQEELPY